MLIVICSSLLPAPAAVADSTEFMVKAWVGDRLLEGRPLSWSKRRVFLLARDGQLVNFRPEEARDFHKSSPRFYGYSTGEIRSHLYQEFGREFDVTGTGHYLVVHPRGQQNQWADRFERLYRSFYHYFRVRGFELKDPAYPLIAIVFHNRDDYQRYASSAGSAPAPNTLGHYDDWTNRISLFDVTGGEESLDWSQNAETIVHETTHQAAFNTGVHTRFSGVPRWLCEGLATLFEARGIWDWSSHRTAGDRINGRQLAAFKQYEASRRQAGSLARLITSDDLFRQDQAAAYSEAWALSYYLCETQPRRFGEYLTRTAAREPFQEVSTEERTADFQAVFGDNLKMVEAQFLRYMKGIHSQK